MSEINVISGASRGFGRLSALALARAGHTVYASMRDATGRNQRVAWYKNGYHLLLRDLQAGVVLGDIVSWVDDRMAPLPSGADQYAFDVLLARR